MLANRLLESHCIEPLEFKGNKIISIDNFILLVVEIYSKLSFDQHIAQLKKKVYFTHIQNSFYLLPCFSCNCLQTLR